MKLQYGKVWVDERGVYTGKRGGGCCIAAITLLGRVEYLAVDKGGRVTSSISSWENFHEKFVKSSVGFDAAFKTLSNSTQRHGAGVRVHELLAYIDPTRKGEVEMATKKPASEKKAAPTPKKEAPKKEAPKKEAPKKEAGAARGRKGAFDPGMKITVLVDKNPKRGNAATRFDLYAKNNTVEKYLAAGGLMADIRWDVKQEFIKVE